MAVQAKDDYPQVSVSVSWNGEIGISMLLAPGRGEGMTLPLEAVEKLLLIDTRNRLIDALEQARHRRAVYQEERREHLRAELAALK